VWLAITDAPLTSGCLEVLSGSHTFGYLPFEREQADGPADTPRNRGLMVRGAADLAGATFTSVPLQAGEAVAFDMRLLHRSGVNDSPQPRLGLNVRYVAPDAFRRGVLTIADVRLLRFTAWMIRHQPAAVAAQIRAALLAAGWRP
jgi:ectoine hydroxylase-related dioxygenase (phytanoyl-CoA dioxygenase family)